MAHLSAAILLSLIISIAQSAAYYNGSFPLAIDHPFNATIGPYNLHSVATLVVEHNTNITVCIVAAEFGLPAYTQYSDKYCLHFFQWNTTNHSTTTESLPLLNIEYSIGIYFVDPTAAADSKVNATVTVNITGGECPNHQIYDNKSLTCTNFTEFKDWNETLSVTFNAPETKIFVAALPWNPTSYVGNMEFSFTPIGVPTTENFLVFARLNGPPSSAYNDGSKEVNGKLSIPTPKPGRWVFYIRYMASNVPPLKATVELQGKVCGTGQAGKDCTIRVSEANDVLNLTVTSTTQYFRVPVNSTRSLFASVTTINGTFIPYLYATRGQIPDEKNADIKNCNEGWCSDVHSVFYNATGAEDWYIAIVSSVGGNDNITAALWFYQHCIPDCEKDSHGQCLDSGKCECEIDYDGVNCNHSRGLGPQYIVLIIIASLVVASAVIGFVAWAYMRQKRGAYEPLT